MSDPDKTRNEALSGLAAIGAARAAEALGQLMGESIEARPPEEGGRGRSLQDVPDAREMGVFFELDGCLDGIVGVVLPGRVCDALARRACVCDSSVPDKAMVESVVMEVANILVSQLANAIADELEGRLLPSVPFLAAADARLELACFLEGIVGPDAGRVEVALLNRAGAPRGQVIFVPTG